MLYQLPVSKLLLHIRFITCPLDLIALIIFTTVLLHNTSRLLIFSHSLGPNTLNTLTLCNTKFCNKLKNILRKVWKEPFLTYHESPITMKFLVSSYVGHQIKES